jgi:hypothetical protein
MTLLQNEQQYSDDSEEDDKTKLPATSDSIHWLSHLFPFYPPLGKTSDNVRYAIKCCLPSAAFVREVVDLYYKQACWW